MDRKEEFRVLELYSGIGGMQYAVKKALPNAGIVTAVEISTVANDVYRHNFPSISILNKGIESLSLEQLDAISATMVAMSPPCQPFTRNGKRLGLQDERCKSFLHFLHLLPELQRKPKVIILENVKGFEGSDAHIKLREILIVCEYNFQEFLISPTDINIPNSRLRYFLVALLRPIAFTFETRSDIWLGFPPNNISYAQKRTNTSGFADCGCDYTDHPQCFDGQMQSLASYLVDEEPIPDELKVDAKVVKRLGTLMDMVNPKCKRSISFTKAYGRYVEGTGSLIDCKNMGNNTVKNYLQKISKEGCLELLSEIELRYFSPRELANIHGYPQSFEFPTNVTTRQQWKLIGNSLNIDVVSRLIELCCSNNSRVEIN